MKRSQFVALCFAGVAVGAVGVALLLGGGRGGSPLPLDRVVSDPDPKVLPPEPTPALRDAARSPVPLPDPLPTSPLGYHFGRSKAEAMALLRVRVLDPWGRPVEDAVVRAVSADGSGRTVLGKRGSGERFDLFVPPGEALRIEAESEPLLYPGAEQPVIAGQGEVVITLRLKGGRLSGRVVASETGQPHPRASLTCRCEEAGISWFKGAQIAPDGTFDLLVPEGTVHLVATAPRREPAEEYEVVRAGQWRSGLDLSLPPPTLASLSGRVIDDVGAPVPGARVELDSVTFLPNRSHASVEIAPVGEVATDEDGRFRFREAGTGKHDFRVSASGLEETGRVRIVLEAGSNAVQVALVRAGRLRVRGVPPDGSPMGTGEIWLTRGGREAGIAYVSPARPGRGSFTSRLVRASYAARVDGVRSVEEAERRSGSVSLGADSIGVPDAEGYRLFEGLAWGDYEVRVDAGRWTGRRAVAVAPGGTASVEVTLTAKR